MLVLPTVFLEVDASYHVGNPSEPASIDWNLLDLSKISTGIRLNRKRQICNERCSWKVAKQRDAERCKCYSYELHNQKDAKKGEELRPVYSEAGHEVVNDREDQWYLLHCQ